jgi:hypothetical protein
MHSVKKMRVIGARRSNLQAIELPGRGMVRKPMLNVRIGPRVGIEHIVIAALLVGFALALWLAFNELDAALKDVRSSLATMATIGN